jgi:diguanylate cyclase (GGDEF)-like protein
VTHPNPEPDPRGAISRLLRPAGDPYFGNDLANANRLVGLAWIVYGVLAAVILPLAPPSGDLHSAGSTVGAAMAILAIGLGISLMRFGWAGFNTLLCAHYTCALLLTLLQLVTRGDGGPYYELYLMLMVTVAATHPVRRAMGYAAVVSAMALTPPLVSHPSGSLIADLGFRLALWTLCSVLLLVLMAQLRRQRLAIRLDGDLAYELARTDALTGLGNRRQLIEDLESVKSTIGARPQILALFDLDGFKAYNDTFGHPAGDSLLTRLGENLSDGVGESARAYRMGGDEFCVLGPDDGAGGDLVARAAASLCERGDGFAIRASHGSVRLPTETADPAEALRLADRRMYAQKSLGRASAGRQTTDVLLKVLAERSPELGTHMHGVTDLCEAVARELELSDEELTPLLQAASLHDVGKAAIPDAILNKPAPLDDHEWDFMRRHTVIGERILSAAPSLTQAARLVRASHESYDGAGYPDGLAGDSIPLGARIIAVCDAFDAMRSDRPYRSAMSVEVALEELGNCAGRQFDPVVVAAFGAVMLGHDAVPA